jgi:hypothetical protein
MASSWRVAAAVVAAAAAIGAGIAPAVAQSATGPTITIKVRSAIPAVTHDVLVQYDNSSLSKVTVYGTISATTSGEVAQLYAQSYPFRKAARPVPGQDEAFAASGGPARYMFTAVPTLATRYSVRLFASSSARTAKASSAVKDVYVVSNQPYYGLSSCTRPVCHETVRVYTYLPASTYKIESAKRWYFYFGLNLSPTVEPPPPTWMYLDSQAKIGKVKRISAREFERTISFSFTINNDGYHIAFAYCSKDTEPKDGLNLPGHHSCGAKKVRSNILYLG